MKCQMVKNMGFVVLETIGKNYGQLKKYKQWGYNANTRCLTCRYSNFYAK